jgi:putative FmdB family regulatory protein
VPTYEYECRQCGHRFEAFQSMKDAPLTACERCGGAVRRQISGGAGLLFKGSGFYQTDYRSESYKKRAKEEGGSKGGAPAGESAKPAGPEKPAGKEKPAGGGAAPASGGPPAGGA